MFKKSGTAKLLGILVVLVLVYLVFNLFDNSGTRSKEFRKELIVIDTSKVDQIIIQKENEQLELKKNSDGWQVKISDEVYKIATSSSVQRTLENILTIKPSRVVARSKDKWKDYQVDSTGTRVIIYEGDKSTLDLIIGRLQFVDQRKYYTYVRLLEEDDTYIADNFLPMSINTSANNFRDNQVLAVHKDSVKQIQFNYRDSSFVLINNSNAWKIGDNATDSTSTAKYLNSLTNLNSSIFYDGALPEKTPDFSLIISGNTAVNIEVKGWLTEENNIIIQSSENVDNLFKDQNLADKIFKNMEYFFSLINS